MNESQIYRAVLAKELKDTFLEQKIGIDNGLNQYDRITNLGRSPEFAFQVIYACLEESTAAVDNKIRTIKEYIKNQLETYLPGKTVEGNPLIRLRQLADRHNKKIKSLVNSVEIDGQPLGAADFDESLVTIPACLRSTTQIYRATASDEQSRGLELDITLIQGH